ncbi:hypothetical protein [Cytobacillus oceanisediminis]|uniref:hypothetical protein n=1 Tax=Cytobacillus oceanisediminis TaxID=665099 RepID=UPI001FB28033|nr:hypothetical protein [Cytobacillus oceanisediminis]UOE58132.1 hypothetical protein IRB79_26865 [Cytobacillus oceanisediminis]
MSTPALNLTNLLANQINGYVAHDKQYSADRLKKITYVTASNGLFRVEKTPVAIFKVKVHPFEKEIPGLLPMEEGPELLIPKIPFKFLQQALSWYIDVYDQDGTEASLLFFWNKENKAIPQHYSDNSEIKGLLADGQLIVYVPRQVNQKGLSEFHMDPMVDYLRKNFALLCETHSHNTMNAFFSSTDDSNENATQFYGVWGKVKDERPQFAFRYVSGDAKVQISPDVLFDWPTVTTTHSIDLESDFPGFNPMHSVHVEETIYMGPFPNLDYPAEWMEQHQKKAPARPAPSYYPYKMTHLFEDEIYETGGAHRFSYGFENAEIEELLEPEDLANRNDIMDNLLDMTGDYARLGYDKVIERTIDASLK